MAIRTLRTVSAEIAHYCTSVDRVGGAHGQGVRVRVQLARCLNGAACKGAHKVWRARVLLMCSL